MTSHELTLHADDTFAYVEGAKLFDQRLASLKGEQLQYKITFKIVHKDLLLKLTSDVVSAKLLLQHEKIKLLEFTKYKDHTTFTIYYENENHKAIVFKVTAASIEKLQVFLNTHSIDFVENIKVETPQPMKADTESPSWDFTFLFQILFFLLVVVGLFYFFTSVSLQEVASSGIFRIIMYICVIASLIIGVFSRLR